MDTWETNGLIERLRGSGDRWMEFLRVPAMSAGVYRLATGEPDPQGPHHEDEVYVIVAGRAMLRVGDEDRPVEQGSVLFVPAGAEHRFHRITEDLVALVVFAPAET